MKRTYYAIYHCNEWKEYSSFRLIGVVCKSKLSSSLAKIRKECKYSREELDTYTATEEMYLNDLDI